MEAIKSAVKILEGAYSFVMISILDPEAMYIVKNTGTMVIGFSENLTNKKEIEKNLSDNISLE
jgi:glucosamine 6-phosphate synthetase-like amidotransferase/phosphosugar isomerase protein